MFFYAITWLYVKRSKKLLMRSLFITAFLSSKFHSYILAEDSTSFFEANVENVNVLDSPESNGMFFLRWHLLTQNSLR